MLCLIYVDQWISNVGSIPKEMSKFIKSYTALILFAEELALAALSHHVRSPNTLRPLYCEEAQAIKHPNPSKVLIEPSQTCE